MDPSLTQQLCGKDTSFVKANCSWLPLCWVGNSTSLLRTVIPIVLGCHISHFVLHSFICNNKIESPEPVLLNSTCFLYQVVTLLNKHSFSPKVKGGGYPFLDGDCRKIYYLVTPFKRHKYLKINDSIFITISDYWATGCLGICLVPRLELT